MKFQRGLFDQPFIKQNEEWTTYHYNQYKKSLELAKESVILLKNEEILPIDTTKVKSIAVIGPNADDIYNQLGDYSPPINKKDGVTVLEGVKKYISLIKDDIEVEFVRGCNLFEDSNEMLLEAIQVSKNVDIIILVLGGSSSRFLGGTFDSNGAVIAGESIQMDCGEGVDCSDIKLTLPQRRLIREISKVNPNIITVLIQGRSYGIAEVVEQSKGVLCSFYPGIQGGIAIADILFGKVSPSGRLPVSIPRDSGQLPVYYNHKASYEGMNYYDIDKRPLYSFGYGLSYTTFQYSHPVVTNTQKENSIERKISIAIQIKNIGDYDTYAVPQLYIRHLQSSVVPRVRELRDFNKLWVNKGEVVECTLTLDNEKLSVWNEEYNFVVEAGELEWYLCDNGQDIFTGIIKK